MGECLLNSVTKIGNLEQEKLRKVAKLTCSKAKNEKLIKIFAKGTRRVFTS